MDIHEILAFCIQHHASDIHLSVGSTPIVRIDGDLEPLASAILDESSFTELLKPLLTAKQIAALSNPAEQDFACQVGEYRMRVNVFHQARGLGAVLRIIPNRIYSFAELQLPALLKDIASLPRGLILVTGATGSGKSTTLAAMIDYINHQRAAHILTIEDPIEFVHQNAKSLINQREVHRDTLSFQAALRAALREDPDVILVGEMRDLETIRLALTAAETGHLVLATLHTTSAAKTIHRIVDVFDGPEQQVIRNLLAESLQAVICQNLLKKIGGGRVGAYEIMLANAAIRNLIREDKTAQMYSVIQTSSNIGMQTLDQHLQTLVRANTIAKATAYSVAVNRDLFV